ncbi:hypothetical protein CPT_Moabite_025 [Serratia phage Moabite]|uniref:Uncharacterized protein n=1 Tax=Serratia phage Moabite TaxID=2587814 RepID=A0A4Y5TNW1_9CAUD|nr:hypothetical protein HWC48_gp025 [Serratia phage Moabite]QDB71057.1 hypothetical protein CPT_Moabite_025 [Serratia phage Moabite]
MGYLLVGSVRLFFTSLLKMCSNYTDKVVFSYQ